MGGLRKAFWINFVSLKCKERIFEFSNVAARSIVEFEENKVSD